MANSKFRPVPVTSTSSNNTFPCSEVERLALIEKLEYFLVMV